MVWQLHVDGLCEPVNPGGISTYGFVARREGQVVHRERGLVAAPGPESTSNVAEYTALLKGLEWLAARHRAGEAVAVHGDSQLVVEQIAGRWKVNESRIQPLHRRARELLARMGGTLQWVPREENAEADGLTQEAYDEAVKANPSWLSMARSQPASQSQLRRLAEYGIAAAPGMDRREASRLLDKAEKERRKAAKAESAKGPEGAERAGP